MDDVMKIIKGNLAGFINFKLTKFEVLRAFEIVEVAKQSGLNMMISGMIETRISMGFGAQLTAGVGLFK